VELYIRDGVLYEGLISTTYRGEQYFAPVGFIKDNNRVFIKVYKGGLLEEVVLNTSLFALNIVFKPDYYAAFSLKKELGGESVSQKTWIRGQQSLPILTDSLGYLVLVKENIVDNGEYYDVEFRIVDRGVNSDAYIEPYSRCYGSIIEILVYATKIKALRSRAQREVLSNFLEYIDFNKNIAYKTCSQEYKSLVDKILRWIREWLGEE